VRPVAGEDIPAQSVTLGEILKRLDQTGAAAKIVILDACRDNPFAPALAPARGLAVALLDNPGKAEAGLARVESKGGAFVAFSTSPGTSAADGSGRHSPFTEAFLRQAREPGVPVEAVFRKVRLAVHELTDGRQIPWETSSLTTPFSFFESGPAGAPSLELTSAEIGPAAGRGTRAGYRPPPTRETLQALMPREAYAEVIGWDMPEYYRLFLDVFGDDPLTLRVHRILSARLEEMSWAMAARWGDPAQLRRYAAVFEGSAHAGEARAMAAAGGAPGAKVCTPAQPKGTNVEPAQPKGIIVEPPAPVLRRASLKQPAPKAAAVRPAPRPGRARPAEKAVEEEEPYGYQPATVPPFAPSLVFGTARRIEGPARRPGRDPFFPRGPQSYPSPRVPADFSPALKQFIDAGRTGDAGPAMPGGPLVTFPRQRPMPPGSFGPLPLGGDLR
jgi:hypothetical protein